MNHDAQAESCLLSCCLMDGAGSLGNSLAAGAHPGWFYEGAHATLFGRLTRMLAAGKTIDLAVVGQELTANNELESVGGYPALLRISEASGTSAALKHHVERVRELFIIRKIALEANRLLESCKNYQGESVEKVVEGPLGRILTLAGANDSHDEAKWAEVVGEAMTSADVLIAAKERPPQTIVNWPWPQMDELFEPMQRGQLVVLGARPSIGKSSLARQIIARTSAAGRHVYFDTLEVNPVQVALQMAATLSGTGVRELSKSHPGDQKTFKEMLLSLKQRGITPSSRDRSLSRIVARLKALKTSSRCDLAVIDHGGLLDDVALAPKEEKVSAIGRVTKTLKLLAGELDMVIILLWQLNRLSANDGNREPKLSDLRDSGSLEEDADKVILLHRPSDDPLTRQGQPESKNKEDLPKFFTNVIQAKGRDDGTAIMSFYFTRRTATFKPIVKEAPAPEPIDPQNKLGI